MAQEKPYEIRIATDEEVDRLLEKHLIEHDALFRLMDERRITDSHDLDILLGSLPEPMSPELVARLRKENPPRLAIEEMDEN